MVSKISPSIFLFETVQPLDRSLLREIQREHRLIVTIEEHRVDGGFGSAVADFYSQERLSPIILLKYGLKNEFTPISAGYDALASYHGFTPRAVALDLLRFFHTEKNVLLE